MLLTRRQVGFSSARLVMLMIAFIGVRISWLITARKELLARFAASAASRAATSSRLAVSRLAMPLSSAWASSRNSLGPDGRPVRAARSPAWRRRAVFRMTRVS